MLAPPALAESLDAAWAAALAANPALQASEANTQASRHLVNSAKANRWPTLSAGAVWARHQPMPKVQTDLTGLTSGLAGLLPPMALARLPGSVAQPVADDKGWSANATVSLPVFTSGKITAGIRAAEAGVEAAEAARLIGGEAVRADLHGLGIRALAGLGIEISGVDQSRRVNVVYAGEIRGVHPLVLPGLRSPRWCLYGFRRRTVDAAWTSACARVVRAGSAPPCRCRGRRRHRSPGSHR